MANTEEFRLSVPEDIGKERPDKWLGQQLEGVSRNEIQEAMKLGNVWQDGVAVTRKTQLRPGAELSIQIERNPPSNLDPHQNDDVEVIFEDEDLLALNKPSGIVTHPGHGTDGTTLVHTLLHLTGGEEISRVGGEDRPGIVHRLDKDTSGVILTAKTDKAHHALVEYFQNRQLEKIYLALVQGKSQLAGGTIDTPIGRHSIHRTRMAVVPEGRPAKTIWKQLQSDTRGYSLWQCQILTGRTHQIRVHCQYQGHPILGDTVYGFHWNERYPKPDRVMLHASRLSLLHPFTGEELHLEAPIPSDMQIYLT